MRVAGRRRAVAWAIAAWVLCTGVILTSGCAPAVVLRAEPLLQGKHVGSGKDEGAIGSSAPADKGIDAEDLYRAALRNPADLGGLDRLARGLVATRSRLSWVIPEPQEDEQRRVLSRLSTDPASKRWCGFAFLYHFMEDHAKRDESLRLARSLAESQVARRYADSCLGVALALTGDVESARRELERSLEIDPDNTLSRVWLKVLSSDVPTSVAPEDFDELRRYMRSRELHYTLGQMLLSKGDVDQGIAQIKIAAELVQDDVEMHFRLGLAYMSAKRWDEARHHLLEATRLRPDDYRGHLHLGVLYARTGSLRASGEEFMTARRLGFRPATANDHQWLALAYLRYKRHFDALRALLTAKRLGGEVGKEDIIEVVKLVSARLRHEVDRREEATALVEDVVSLFPTVGGLRLHLAAMLFAFRGEHSRALEESILGCLFEDNHGARKQIALFSEIADYQMARAKALSRFVEIQRMRRKGGAKAAEEPAPGVMEPERARAPAGP